MVNAPPPKTASANARRDLPWSAILTVSGAVISALWLSLCIAYMSAAIGLHNLAQLPPQQMGIFLLGLFSVPGMLAMLLGYRLKLLALDRSSRTLSKHFREFQKFSQTEHEVIIASSTAAKREALSLFEAAQASLAALNQVENNLKQHTQVLIAAATESSEHINRAGKQIEDRAGALRLLTGQFHSSAGELQRHAGNAAGSVEAALTRMSAAQAGWTEQTAQLDKVVDHTMLRLASSGEALGASSATLNDAVSQLDSRREQILQLGDAVTNRLQQASDRINSELHLIDERASALDDQVRRMEDAGTKLNDKGQTLARTGQDHIVALNAAADQLWQRTADVSQTFAGSLEKITGLSGEAAQRLDDAAGRINAGLDGIRRNVAETAGSVDRFGELGERMSRYRQEIEDSLGSALERLDYLATRFQGEIGTAGEVEHAIGETAQRIVEALARVRSEQEMTTRELDNFGDRSHGISLRLEGLRAAAMSGVSDLIGETDRIQKRSESLTDELKGQSIAFGEAMNRADSIASIIRNTGTLIEQAVANADQASRQLRGEFHTVGQDMETHGGRLRSQADQAVETMRDAKARMEETIGQIGSVIGSLDGKANDINFTVSSSFSRLSELTNGLERARAEVIGSSDKVAAHIENSTQTLRASADLIHGTAEQVTHATNRAAEVGSQLAEAGDALRDRVVEITQSAGDATDKLKSSAAELSQSAEQTKKQLGQIAREVRQENEAIDGTLARITGVESALRQAAALVDDIVAKAAKSAEGVREEMHAVGREIALQSKVLADTSGSNGTILDRTRDEMEVVVGRVQDAFGNLNQKASEINFVVSTAVNRLAELSRGLEGAQMTIDEAAGGASEKMSKMAAALHSEFGGVHEIADRALERLEKTLTAVAATSANVDAETQTIELRLAATFNAAETGGAQFSEKIGAALSQFERAEKSLEDGQARLTGVAEDTTAQILRLTQSLGSGGADLGNAAMVTSERIVGASALVETRLQSVNAIADEVRRALGNFAADLGAVSGQSETITEAMARGSAILRDNIVQIARTAVDTGETLKETTATLLEGAVEVSDKAVELRTKISRATSELRKEATVIAETGTEARALTAQVAALLGERAMEMAITARQVAAETQTMREANAKMQRDVFLDSAKTVLNALGSLSVDLSRVLDTDLPEELRAELVRGDIPGFVRRLAATRDQVSTPLLRAKFANDGRFRSHVQAYMAQFEELAKQAAAVDNGEVLGATLVSSDIGKIYAFLSSAIGTDREDIQQEQQTA